MEEHVLQVADFLRRTPFVNLALLAAPSATDAEALKAEAVTARLREFQKERGLKDDKAVIGAYFKARLLEVKPPRTLEEQLALLREREAVPDRALDDLAHRRIDATRERLVSGEGIPAERLTVAEARADGIPAPATDAAGRVEFNVVAGGE
jgi:hypothetical protein